jgi:biopolymer transport protein ExbD
MASKINNSDDDPIVDINITPFVDIVLVLLVIFMVTAHFMTNRGIHLQLPKAASSEKIKTIKNFQIVISADGKYMLENKVVTLNQIRNAMTSVAQDKEKISVTLTADKGVIYDSVIRVMDVLRLEGVSDFALQLEPEN